MKHERYQRVRSGTWRTGVMVLAIAAVAAGCSGSDTDAGAVQASPIAEFLGEESPFGFGDDSEAQARQAEQSRKQEEAVAACMKEQGFEYIPQDNSQFFGGLEGDLDYGSREYTEKYGFGITTHHFSQTEIGPELVGYDDSAFQDQTDNDPNQAIVEAMDEATRMAYQEALWGPPEDFPSFDETMSDEEIAEADQDFGLPSGCFGDALRSNSTIGFYEEFSDEMEELYESAFQDPRIQAKQTELIDCVNEDGHDLTADEDIWQTMDERYRPQLDEIDAEIGGFPGEDMTEEDFAAMSPEELDELFGQGREVTPEAKSKMAELQEEEIAIAVKYFDCGGSQDELEGLYSEVLAEYEEQFLENNADRLAKYKAEA